MNEPSGIILKFQGNAQFKLEYSKTYAGDYQKKPFTRWELFFSFTFQNMAHVCLVYADLQDRVFQEQQSCHSDDSAVRNVCTMWWKGCGQGCIEMQWLGSHFLYFPEKEKLYSQATVSIFILLYGKILRKMWLVFSFIFHSGTTIWNIGDSMGRDVHNLCWIWFCISK